MKHEQTMLAVAAILVVVLAGVAANTDMFQDAVLLSSGNTVTASPYCAQLKAMVKAKDPRAKSAEVKRELTLCTQLTTNIRCSQITSSARSSAVSGSKSGVDQSKKQAASCAKSAKSRCQVVTSVAANGNLTRDFPELLAMLTSCKK